MLLLATFLGDEVLDFGDFDNCRDFDSYLLIRILLAVMIEGSLVLSLLFDCLDKRNFIFSILLIYLYLFEEGFAEASFLLFNCKEVFEI